jgi:hypothetical protein
MPAAATTVPRFDEVPPDIMADVMEELTALSRPKDAVILEREQAEIAATAGQLAREFMGGHKIAQIHPEVFDTWVRQRGIEFFTKHDGVEYLARHFPSTVTKYQPARLKLHVHRSPVQGRRGRWASPVPCAA